ncbi:MAG TPA: permease-like cell division protein FtsX [Candidatus Eremiobacteraceae bacterium]|nr:permease-like cell division protein FtsX [Candidatus Eremiobacteraceae bacterium]
MLDWGRVRFFWAEVGQNFTRNIAMALTAVGTIAISVVLLGVFLFMRSSFEAVMQNIVGQVAIAVYLHDDVKPAAIAAMTSSLKADPRVDNVRFVSKKRAMLNLRQRLRGQMNLNIINTNPLPNTIIVHTKLPSEVPALAQELQRKPGVDVVNYGSGVTEKLLRAEAVFSAVGVGVIALLLFATSLIMFNTIRLTVFARQREIRIMQLVGATSWAVRWPFVFEGMLSGLLGAAVGLLALTSGYRSLVPKLAINVPFIPFTVSSIPLHHLALELLAVGVLVGMLSSMLSVSRYLQTA